MAKSKNKGPRQKQRAGVYTMMLIVSFVALSIGSAILYLHLKRYNYWESDGGGTPPTTRLMPASGWDVRSLT